jgi:cysteine desulfurase
MCAAEQEAMRPETVLVSVMAVNNEIGVVQPLKEIGQLCRSKKVFFHTDAAQVSGGRSRLEATACFSSS